MILTFIIIVAICQIIIYLFIDKIQLERGKNLTFLLILIGHLFIFPQFYFPDLDESDIGCAMPLLGITLAFWVVGGGTTIMIHLIYHIIEKVIAWRFKNTVK